MTSNIVDELCKELIMEKIGNGLVEYLKTSNDTIVQEMRDLGIINMSKLNEKKGESGNSPAT